MRKFLYLLAILSMACVGNSQLASVGNLTGSALSKRGESPELPTVSATNGLRLRSLPDSLGGEEWTIMPYGSAFYPYYCQDVRGTNWTFGYFTNRDGQTFVGWAAAR